MNIKRRTFFGRLTGALAALFVPWKVGAKEPSPLASISDIYFRTAGPIPCPCCKGTGWTEYTPSCMCRDPYLPNYPDEVRRVPCHTCRPDDYASWDYKYGSSLLAHLAWERDLARKYGKEPRFFHCSRETLGALVRGINPEMGRESLFFQIESGGFQQTSVLGMTWLDSPMASYGTFLVSEKNPRQGPPGWHAPDRFIP